MPIFWDGRDPSEGDMTVKTTVQTMIVLAFLSGVALGVIVMELLCRLEWLPR